VSEFPKLIKTYRRFQNHPFEFITISVDSLDDREQAEDFLQDQHAALARRTQRLLKSNGRTTNNFIFAGDDLEQLAESLDEEWTGVQPHTLLVAPSGQILFRETGEVDIDSLETAIVKYIRANFLK
jgi:hypothetical protein